MEHKNLVPRKLGMIRLRTAMSGAVSPSPIAPWN